jgi:hypothetical protein
MFGANPIPESEVANLNGTTSNEYSGNVSTLDTFYNATSVYVNAQVLKNSSTHIVSYSTPTPEIKSIKFRDASNSNNSNLVENNEVIKTTQTDFVCGFYNPEYIIYSSLCSFFIPCVFMVFLYSRIFWVSSLN